MILGIGLGRIACAPSLLVTPKKMENELATKNSISESQTENTVPPSSENRELRNIARIRRRTVSRPTFQKRPRIYHKSVPSYRRSLQRNYQNWRNLYTKHLKKSNPYKNVRRRMNESQPPANGQSPVTVYDTYNPNANPSDSQSLTQTQLDIGQAFAQTQESPSVIVVNQDPIVSNQAFTPSPCEFQADLNLTSFGIANEKPKIVTFAEIDTLILTISSIQKIIDDIYGVMPQDEIKNPTTESDSLNTFFDHAEDVIKFYMHVRTFVQIVYGKREELLQNINFLGNNVVLFKVSEIDMLRFYGLDEKFYSAQEKSLLYEKSDIKFKFYYDQISDQTIDYMYEVNSVLTESKKLESIIKSLIKQIGAIDDTSYENQFINTIDKLDGVMMVLVRVAEFKDVIHESVNSLETHFVELKSFRPRISEIIANINELSASYRNNDGISVNLNVTPSGVGINFTFSIQIIVFLVVGAFAL